MNFPLPRGRVRHALASVRRRAGRVMPKVVETLEERRLLAAGNFGINVEITPFSSFVNLLQVPGNWSTAPGQSNPIVLNASNDPSSDAMLTFDLRVNQSWNGPDPNAVAQNLSGTYHLSFNGQATIQPSYQGSSTPFTVQTPVYNSLTNTTSVDLVVPASNYSDFFAISFVNTRATPGGAINTGFSNATLIRPGYAANSTQLYSNEFIAALKPYNVLRYLDPENTNGQPYYNGNTLVTVDAPQVDQTGMPWEYLIALANQTHTDMWVNIPQGATNAYVTAMAGIFKNGGTVGGVSYPGLNTSQKVYLEYSNEVWGGIQQNAYYQNAAVQNSATNQPLSTFPSNLHVYDNADGTTSNAVWDAVGRRYLERTNDIGQIFQGVMGSDPTHQRIRPVLGWQENNTFFYGGALDWFQHFFGPASTAFYGMGNAIYWGPTDFSSVNAAISSLAAQETTYSIPNDLAFTTVAQSYGLKNVSYEGGPGIGADPSTAAGQVALATSRDPRMEQLIYQHYVNFFADGGDTAMFYDGPFSPWSPMNEWGAAEPAQYGNPSASAKYRGTVDVANAAPVVANAGLAIAPGAPIDLNVANDSSNSSFVDPYTGQRDYWALNLATAGTYDLVLMTNPTTNYQVGQVEVFVNGAAVGSPINVTSNSMIDLGNLALPAGFDALSILTLSGQSNSHQNDFLPAELALQTPGSPLVGDTGFERVGVGSGSNAYQYNPGESAWTFSSSSGVTGNNSGFTSGNPAAPQGSQAGFIQVQGTITQTITIPSTGAYAISFQAAQRGNSGGQAEDFQVLVDGNVVATFKPTGTAYQAYSTGAFVVGTGSHIIEFLGLDAAGGDNTILLDAVSVAASTAIPPAAPMPEDSGFELVSVGSGYGSYRYDPSGSAWTFAGASGVSGNNSAFTSGNPAAPQGSQVAYLQGQGSLTQSVMGWAAGSFTVSLLAAQRGNSATSAEDFQVLVDGNVVGTIKPTSSSYQAYSTPKFTVTAGAHVIKILGLNTVGGDNTALIDAVSVAVAASAAAPPTAPTPGDAGFEAVAMGPGSFQYGPSGSAWTFSGAGVSGNNSAFTSGNPAAPQGTQVAFLQGRGTITQAVAGWAAGYYTVSFQAAQRGNNGTSVEDFQILVDGNLVGTFKPTGTAYQAYSTASFAVGAGSHVIQFVGLNSGGRDNTAFLDAVAVTASASAPPTAPTPGDAGFDALTMSPGSFQYGPSGSAWTFAGGSGVSGNNSAFTSGNPAAPQGSQVGFIQGQGTITQAVTGWAAGSFAISFQAAQRGNHGTSVEDFEIVVDGSIVGTFQPTGAAYQSYSSKKFTVTAGSHTVQFVGLDSAGGDNTAFLDNVTIA